MDDHDYFMARSAQHKAQAAKATRQENRVLHQRFADLYKRRAIDTLVDRD